MRNSTDRKAPHPAEMFWKPSSPRQSVRGTPASSPLSSRVPPMSRHSRRGPGPDTFPAWTRGCPQVATPWGSRKVRPPPHSASLCGYPGLRRSPDLLIALHQRPPGPARAHTFRASSGKLELPRIEVGDPAGQLDSLGLSGAPNQALFSGLRASGPSLHARSYSGADCAQRRAERGGAAGR